MSWEWGAELLRGYAALAHHRTGTGEDAATLDLVEAACRRGGAMVRRIAFDFSLYDWRAVVALDGAMLETLPLYYAAAGEVSLTDAPLVIVKADPSEDAALLRRISRAAARAQAAGAHGLVAATDSATGGLYAPNVIATAAGAFPIWLIGAADLRAGARVEARLDARVRSGRSANLVADYGAVGAPPALIITTPLSGWFACVGERAGGVLLALRLCEMLSNDFPVRLLATSGHELGHLGAAAARAKSIVPDRTPVLHLGSCIAARDAQLRTLVHAKRVAATEMTRILQMIGGDLETPDTPGNPASWQGESEEWASAHREMISIAGSSPEFHTPQDSDLTDVIARLASSGNFLEHAARILCSASSTGLR